MKFKLFSLLLILMFSASCLCNAQTYRAYLGSEGIVETELAADFYRDEPAKTINQLSGFPKRLEANPSFKNMRGVAIQDINNDNVNEIIIATASTLYAIAANGTVLWSKVLNGTAIYPPTVGDMDLDGNPEIAQATGGSPANGRIYLVDNNGNDLPGWPQNFSNNWILCSPVMADVDKNDTLELIFNERVYPQGRLHICKIKGNSISPSWPVTINATPSVTPSVGDINGDGNREIVLCSYNDVLAFDLSGSLLSGFPVLNTNTTFSYQSPLLADLDNNGKLNIIGSTIGDIPEYYVLNYDGSYHSGWPVPVPDNNWTYCPPAVADLNQDGNFAIFFTRPINDTILPMLYGFDLNATPLSNFPVSTRGGDEGLVTMADVDNCGSQEIITGSNLCAGSYGFIHAFKTDGSGEATGFPLRPQGFSFMNGADLADVNDDGMLDLVSLSYDQTGTASDSISLNVYELNVPCGNSTVLFSTYKGSNTRQGLITRGLPPYSVPQNEKEADLHPRIQTNPAGDILTVLNPLSSTCPYSILDLQGRILAKGQLTGQTNRIDIHLLKPGLYFLMSGEAKDIDCRKFVRE
jgi:hypothetical protein